MIFHLLFEYNFKDLTYSINNIIINFTFAIRVLYLKQVGLFFFFSNMSIK